jgi:hypothetical protein
MEKTVLDIVASIEKNDFANAIRLLDTSQEKPLVLAKAIDLLSLKMYEMTNQIEMLRNQVAIRESLEDKYAQSFIETICMSINSPVAALTAATLYSSAWFSELEFSTPVKISFAQRLIDTVAVYNKSYVSDLWRNVVAGKPEALRAIEFNVDVTEGI